MLWRVFIKASASITTLAASLVALCCIPAHSQDASDLEARPVEDETPTIPSALRPTISSSIPALGDFKNGLLAHGVNLELDYIQDTFGNVTGGVRQGATYESVLFMQVDSDLGTLADLSGASFRVSAYQIQGLGLSGTNIYNYATISSLEALPTTRLYKLWVDQKLFSDTVLIRVGQLSADAAFFISDFAGLYINSTFGWPTIYGADLPSGGPAYPLATPAVSVRLTPSDEIKLLAEIFDGDPAGAGFTGLQQSYDPAGINFRVKDPPLVFGEAQFSYNQQKTSQGLAGTIRLGAWRAFGAFSDVRFGLDGLSLADPRSNGQPLQHNGDYSVYGVIDQMLWRLPGDDPKKGIGAFARVAASPPDRNLMNFYADAGVNFMGVFAQRPNDSFGCAASYSNISPDVGALDGSVDAFSGKPFPIRNYELAVELTYHARVLPGWSVQPDFQYIFHPDGGAGYPLYVALKRIPDAAVFGVRTLMRF